jgi:hypothetical protein
MINRTRFLIAFCLLVLPLRSLSGSEGRDLEYEIDPKVHTYLIRNYYDLLRKHQDNNYIAAIKPVFIELGCSSSTENINKFNEILLNATSSADFSINVFEQLNCI